MADDDTRGVRPVASARGHIPSQPMPSDVISSAGWRREPDEPMITVEGEPLFDLSMPVAPVQRPGRRRRLVTGGIALVLLAASVAGAVWQSRTTPELLTTHPTGSPRPSAGGVIGATRVYPTSMVFTDYLTGYAVANTCAPADNLPLGCPTALEMTTDGGSTWHRMALPQGLDSTSLKFSDIYPIEGGMVVDLSLVPNLGPGLGNLPPTPHLSVEVPQDPLRWLLGSDGQWRALPSASSTTVDEIPTGGQLIFTSVDLTETLVPGEFTSAGPSSVAVVVSSHPFSREPQVLLPDGSAATLRTPPPGQFADAHATIADDGSIWVRGSVVKVDVDGTYGTTAKVLMSPDRGRTWRQIELPEGAFPSDLYTQDGQHVYLLSNNGDNGEVNILASSDAGASWTQILLPTPIPDGGLLPQSNSIDDAYPSVAPLSDGGLLVAAAGEAWQVGTDGTAIQVLGPGTDRAAKVVTVLQAGAQAVAVVEAGEAFRFLITTDGRSWAGVTL